jgi:hypothetical protein
LTCYLRKQNQPENDVREFIQVFRKNSKRFYNLRKLSIKAPYATIEGDMIRDLMHAKSTYTHLDLDMFTFHSPVQDMWVSPLIKLEDVTVTFNDGVGFPLAGSELLKGVECHLPHLRDLWIYNESPHKPTVKISQRFRWGTNVYKKGIILRYRNGY